MKTLIELQFKKVVDELKKLEIENNIILSTPLYKIMYLIIFIHLLNLMEYLKLKIYKLRKKVMKND